MDVRCIGARLCVVAADELSPEDGCIARGEDQAVGVVLVSLVRELALCSEVERNISTARENMCAHKRVRLGDEGVAEVGDAALLAQRPRLLDEDEAERAEGRAHRRAGDEGERRELDVTGVSRARVAHAVLRTLLRDGTREDSAHAC
eukprot:6196564-Pleurochrysis_carterae.AAC.4